MPMKPRRPPWESLACLLAVALAIPACWRFAIVFAEAIASQSLELR